MTRLRLLVAALLVAGCAGGSPSRQPPDAPVTPPAAFSAAGTSGNYPGGEAWWKSFGDPRLTEFVVESLTRNPDLVKAEARVRAAAARARIAGADLLPAMSAGAVAGRSRQFTGLSDPLPRTLTGDAYGVSLDVTWEIDVWGRIRAGRSAAVADFERDRALKAAVALSLAAQTAKAYLACAEGELQAAVARADLESAEALATTIQDRFSRGLESALDTRFAEGETADARARLALRERVLDAARRQLETLAGRYPEGAAATTGDLPALPGPVPPGLPAEILARRPDLVAAERAYAAATSRTREARAALYPRIALTAAGGVQSDDLSEVLSGDFTVWSLLANLAAPLYSGGRLRANVEQGEAMADEAAAAFGSAVLAAFREVETALAAEAYLARETAAVGDLEREARAGLDLSEDRYRTGLVDILTVLEARRRYYQARSRLLTLRRIQLDTRIDLHVALGGGFSAAPGPEPDRRAP